MAEIAVSFLVERLVTLAEEEIRLLSGVRNEIKNIKEEFQSIKVLLRNADSKVDIDEGVREWVTQVRGVAYEIEDILDEYFLNHAHGSKVVSVYDIFQKIRGFFKRLKSQQKIGNKIIDIKKRIQEISSRKERYCLSNLDVTSSSAAITTVKHDPREDALFLDETDLVGTEGPREKLIGYICEPNAKLSVVSVLGEGGLGKTTVVKKVFDSPRVKHQFEYRAWLTISQTPDIKTLLTALLKHLFPMLSAEDSTIKLKQQLNDNLRGKSYIVVLDDIWTVATWKELKNALPDNKGSGCRILVTTRNQEVANTCVLGCGHMYSLECLSSDHSWKLLYMKTCNSRIDDMSSYPEDLLKAKSEKFLKKCCGLPLAIVAMGGLLSMKRINEWEQIYQTLGSLPLEDLNMVISLSFNDLPYNLKPCFLFMCMFPEDYAIKCSRLLRLWVGQGFVERKQGINVTMEENAKSYLDELIQRCLIQVDYMDERKKVVKCKIHDVMRDFIIRKARDQNFAEFIAQKQDELQFLYGDASARLLQHPRHLSICMSKGGDEAKNDILVRNNNRLVVHSRSLLVFASMYAFITTNMFLSFRLLKVLDLEDVRIQEFPDEVINLFYLRYLSLRGSGSIESLPNTVRKLVNLETLDIKGTSIEKLPVTILKLKQLRNLLTGNIIYGVNLPVGIGCLINLEKLDGIHGNEDVVKNLGMLTRLRRLSIRILKANDGKQLFASIQKMKYLRNLNVTSQKFRLIDTQSLRSPPPFLRCLYIMGILNKLPDWFSLLQNLEKLTLSYSTLVDDPFQVLQTLPNIVILNLEYYSFVGEKLCISNHGFPRLKKLILGGLQNLNNIEVERGAMPAIQTTGFWNCPNLKNIPGGINHLLTLQTILYWDMPDTFEEQLMDHQTQLRQKGILFQVEHRIM